jgi:hypothetical protein
LYFCPLQQSGHAFLGVLSDFGLAAAEAGEDAVADDAQVVLHQQFEGLVYFQQHGHAVEADFDVGFADLFADDVHEVGGGAVLAELVGVLQRDLFYFG